MGWNCSQQGWLPSQEAHMKHTGPGEQNFPPQTGQVHSPLGMQMAK